MWASLYSRNHRPLGPSTIISGPSDWRKSAYLLKLKAYANDLIFDLTFDLAFDPTFDLSFDLTFNLTFDLTFGLTFDLTFNLTFDLTFDLTSC